MRIKITPLNIVAAAALMAILLLLFNEVRLFSFQVSGMKTLFVMLFLMIAIVAFISDILFRKLVRSLKRLWVIELALISLTVVIAILLKGLMGQ